MSTPKIAEKMRAILNEMERLPERVADDDGRMQSLRPLQAQVARLVEHWPGIGKPIGPEGPLVAWMEMAHGLQEEYSDQVLHVEEIAKGVTKHPKHGHDVWIADKHLATTWIAHAKSVVELLIKLAENATAQQLPDSSTAPVKIDSRKKAFLACQVVHDHPDWSDAKIAEAVDVHRSTLSRNTVYQQAAKLARQKPPPPKGDKDKEGNVEASSEGDDADLDDKIDWNRNWRPAPTVFRRNK